MKTITSRAYKLHRKIMFLYALMAC